MMTRPHNEQRELAIPVLDSLVRSACASQHLRRRMATHNPFSEPTHRATFKLHGHRIGDACFRTGARGDLVVHYGDYLSSSLQLLHDTLTAGALNQRYCFCAASRINLHGYDVELAIKKHMDYRVMDDRNVGSVEVGVDGSATLRPMPMRTMRRSRTAPTR